MIINGVEGCLITIPNYNYFCILEDEDKLHPMDYPYLDEILGTFDGKATPINPETICQFTGLLDKNGNKIWEHDIVKLDKDVKDVFDVNDGEVRYGWGGFYIKEFALLNSLNCLASVNCVLRGEVIGNVIDNPELLER